MERFLGDQWFYAGELSEESAPTVRDLPGPPPLSWYDSQPDTLVPLTALWIGLVAMMASLWGSVVLMVTMGVVLITLMA
jgi:hypothetical protein